MKCPACGVEMMLFQKDQQGKPVYVCRNPRCPQFDKRLKKEESK